jgi:peptidoglycan/LPS O-acetylase OafA/YrhL
MIPLGGGVVPLRAPNHTFRSIVWIRGVAAWLVVWCHLFETFCRTHGISAPYVEAVNLYVGDGLKIDVGLFGVVLFFVVSGFIITHVALQESQVEFAVKRIMRIYPPLIVSVLICAAVYSGYQLAAGIPLEGQAAPSWQAILRSMIVVNGIFEDPQFINPVFWSLVLELVFYAFTFAMLPVLKRAPLAAAIIQLALYVVILRWPIGAFERLAIGLLPFCACLFAAQVIYLGWSGRIERRWMLVLLLAWWVVDQWGYRLQGSNPLTIYPSIVWHIYAFLIFGVLLALEEKLSVPRLIRNSADMSYSVYLLHLPIGYAVLSPLLPVVGYTPAVILALVAIAIISWWSYRWIEQPSQRAARVLVRWIKATMSGLQLAGAARVSPERVT